ncbi:MAG: hypothetical protein LUB59_07420 [Candidatus Gastranaerophilales bacterium]|nr:hypothetical protein [Candidatus Gastranaerophilales bacterium]
MKKFLISLFILFSLSGGFTTTAFAEVFDYVGGNFDWLYLTNSERKQRVTQLFNIMFPKGYVTNFPRGMLKDKLGKYLKDADYKIHYDAVCAGYTHYKDVDLQPFTLGRSRYVYMYALQYPNAPQKTFYYDAMGRLKFIDFRYGGYPEFPYYTKKYAINGKLVRAMYLQSADTMYIFSNKGSFIGVKYQNTIYGFNYTK